MRLSTPEDQSLHRLARRIQTSRTFRPAGIAAAAFALALVFLPGASATPQEQPQTFTVAHSFTGSDGEYPCLGTLISDAAGNLYGTTPEGGSSGAGTVFELVNSSGTYSEIVLHSFMKSDGAFPYAGVVRDAAGNLYGATEVGGASGDGTIFELVNSSGTYTETILYSFTGSDGAHPFASLIRDAAGNLYGTTEAGGASGDGTVFELVNSSGTYSETVLHSFTESDGAFPFAALVRDAAGNLYGTTQAGGASGDGTVFELVKTSGAYRETVLHSFAKSDGAVPFAGLVRDAGGNLYGATEEGGPFGYGTVFELVSSSGTYHEVVLHGFMKSDGAAPFAGLIRDAAGNLYGTTEAGGASGDGTVFELANSSGIYSESVLHSFAYYDGAFSYAGLVLDPAGHLYGTTVEGGASGDGAVFELSPSPGTSSAANPKANPRRAAQ